LANNKMYLPSQLLAKRVEAMKLKTYKQQRREKTSAKTCVETQVTFIGHLLTNLPKIKTDKQATSKAHQIGEAHDGAFEKNKCQVSNHRWCHAVCPRPDNKPFGFTPDVTPTSIGGVVIQDDKPQLQFAAERLTQHMKLPI
jgi:hypothetical protein